MQIQSSTSQIGFRARFLHSESLQKVAEYAVENGKFDKLNQSRKNISKHYIDRRLMFDLNVDEKGFPYAVFTRYVPKYSKMPQTIEDYKNPLKIIYKAGKKMNPLKYGLQLLVRLGNNAPHNKMYKNVIIGLH